MVVNDLNIAGAAIFPAKADPPALVDPDAVLTLPVPFQGFQVIAGRDTQVLEKVRTMQVEKLAPRGPLKGSKARHRLIVKQCHCRLVLEGLDHQFNIVRKASYFKSITR